MAENPQQPASGTLDERAYSHALQQGRDGYLTARDHAERRSRLSPGQCLTAAHNLMAADPLRPGHAAFLRGLRDGLLDRAHGTFNARRA